MNAAQRQEAIRKYYDRSDYFNTADYKKLVFDMHFNHFLNFDLGYLDSEFNNKGFSTSTEKFPGTVDCKSNIVALQGGILAGLSEVRWFYEKQGIRYYTNQNEDTEMSDGKILTGKRDPIIYLEGKKDKILLTRMPALLLLGYMSGIATSTYELVKIVSRYSNGSHIAATRKRMHPGIADKAVYIGCGLTHRLGLYDRPMIKRRPVSLIAKSPHYDQNTREGVISAWIDGLLKEKGESLRNGLVVEIGIGEDREVIAADMLDKLPQEYPSIIMLDNFNPKQVIAAMQQFKESRLLDDILIEVSGNVNAEFIQRCSDGKTPMPDVFSVGAITHSAPSLDFSLKDILSDEPQ